MCRLYSFRRSAEEVQALFRYDRQAELPLGDHIGPSAPIAIVRREQGRRVLAIVQWGFTPPWLKELKRGRPLANARAESVLDRQTFRNSMERRRCLVPADGFYQWKGDVPGQKQPFRIHRPGHELFAIAGLWQSSLAGEGGVADTAVVITTKANKILSAIHDRMPAIIMPQDFDRWLNCDQVSPEEAARLLAPAPEEYLIAEPVSLVRPRKASPRDDGKAPTQLKLF
jgi:putative SOS response-associated peptidase YedK